MVKVTHLLLQIDPILHDLVLKDVELVPLSWLLRIINLAAVLHYRNAIKHLVQIPESPIRHLLESRQCVLKRN